MFYLLLTEHLFAYIMIIRRDDRGAIYEIFKISSNYYNLP